MSRIAEHIRTLPRSGIRDFFELVIGRDDVISLGVGEPDFVTPWHIREATIFALERGKTMYTSNLGLLKLREEIVKYAKKQTGKEYDPKKEAIVTVGVSEALDIAMRALITPGDEVIYHSPSYVSYAPTISMAYGVPVALSTTIENDFNPRADEIEKLITDKTKVILLNLPNNPTGATGTKEDLQRIAKLAVKHDIVVLVDEIYCDITYDEFYSISQDLPKENMVYLNGFSKAYAMTGYRVGYACSTPEIIEGMMKIHQYSMLCAPILGQEAGIEALRRGDEEKERMRKEYGKRRNLIVKSFNDMGLDCFMPKGAFYAFPSVEKTGLTGMEFATKLLEEEDVAVVPGSAFGPEGTNHIRCAYAVSEEELTTAIGRMKKFLARL